MLCKGMNLPLFHPAMDKQSRLGFLAFIRQLKENSDCSLILVPCNSVQIVTCYWEKGWALPSSHPIVQRDGKLLNMAPRKPNKVREYEDSL